MAPHLVRRHRRRRLGRFARTTAQTQQQTYDTDDQTTRVSSSPNRFPSHVPPPELRATGLTARHAIARSQSTFKGWRVLPPHACRTQHHTFPLP
jgi:hypothetical protein